MEKIEEKPCSTNSVKLPKPNRENLSFEHTDPSLVKSTSVRRHQYTNHKILYDAKLTKDRNVCQNIQRRSQKVPKRGKKKSKMVLRSQVQKFNLDFEKSKSLLRRKERLESLIRVLRKFQLKQSGSQNDEDLNEKIKNFSNECVYISFILKLILMSQDNKPTFYEWSERSKNSNLPSHSWRTKKLGIILENILSRICVMS